MESNLLDAYLNPPESVEDDLNKVKNPYEAMKDYVEYLDSLPRAIRRKHFKMRFSDLVKKQANLK